MLSTIPSWAATGQAAEAEEKGCLPAIIWGKREGLLYSRGLKAANSSRASIWCAQIRPILQEWTLNHIDMYLMAGKYLRWRAKRTEFKYISAQGYYYIENTRGVRLLWSFDVYIWIISSVAYWIGYNSYLDAKVLTEWQDLHWEVAPRHALRQLTEPRLGRRRFNLRLELLRRVPQRLFEASQNQVD